MRLNHQPILFQQPKQLVQFQAKKTDSAKQKLNTKKEQAKIKADNLRSNPLARAATGSAVISGGATLLLSGGALAPALLMAGVGAGVTVGVNKARTSMIVPRTKAKLKSGKS